MSKQQYAWLQALSLVIFQQHDEDDQDDPLSREMRDVFAVGGYLVRFNRQAANEEVVAALILVLIYAWNCAKYRARIGNSGHFCAKYIQNEAAQFFALHFALSLAVRALHEKRGQILEPAPLCQMNSTPTERRS